MPFAEELARKFCNKVRYADTDEYISYAQYKLLTVCPKLTNKKSARTFVRKSITGYLQNHLRDNGRKIKLPRGLVDLRGRVRKYKRKNPGATDRQIREALKVTEGKWLEYEQAFDLEFTPLTEIIPAQQNQLPTYLLEMLASLDDEIYDELVRVYIDKQPVNQKYAAVVNKIEDYVCSRC